MSQDAPTAEAEYLTELRKLAGDLVHPWDHGQTLASLSSARLKAVRAAAMALEKLVQTKTTGAPVKQRAAPKRSARTAEDDLADFDPALESQLGITLDDLARTLLLDSVTGFGPMKFKQLADSGRSVASILDRPEELPIPGKTGDKLRDGLRAITDEERHTVRARAARQMTRARELNGEILTYGHPHYPQNVLMSNNPAPVLYAVGDCSVLREMRTVACVGSRAIRAPYAALLRDFATFAVGEGFAVVSGFAIGADRIAHEAALSAGGATVCVMPNGLDLPYPPEHKSLYAEFLERPGVVFMSEFGFGVRASTMNLQKRNKMIVAAARGVLVGQSDVKGGAMNAFRASVEQRKPIATFQADEGKNTSGNDLIGHEVKVVATTLPLATDRVAWTQWLSTL